MSFKLPALPWEAKALEPYVSEKTIGFHYGKHHQGYVNKLNALAKTQTELASMSIEDIIMKKSGKAYNLAAQIFNHTFYWHSMSPKGGNKPTGAILKKIEADFGSFEEFQKVFTTKAATHFGSGWCWLVLNKNGKLEVVDTHDAVNPMSQGLKPILTIDVWEHAYYLDKQNRRGDYIADFWKVVNWEFANKNL